MKIPYAVPIVEHVGENNFKVNKETLKEIYGNKKVANLPLVVLCIAGAARKGKSFMLNFFLDYLIHKEKSPNKPWILDDTTRLNGFEFQDGEDRMTLGIWAWNHIFIIENDDGEKVAVSLIDSQGTFDRSTSYEDCSAIFAMTSMFSSIMCFNVFTDLQEDKLNDLSAFIDHGKKIVENIDGSGKLFQNLVFIIRDCNCFKKYSNEENGGQKYVEKMLGDVQNKELQNVRSNIKKSYEKMQGFIFPYPGEKVAQEKTSNISEMDQKFVNKAKEMVETLLSPTNLQPKKLGTAKLHCRDFLTYIPLCVQCFNDNPQFAPQAVQAVNRNFMISLEVKRAIKAYETLMDEDFAKCLTDFDTATLYASHDKQCMSIKTVISDRIKNVNIKTEIIEKLMEEIKNSFQNYVERNKLLVENEKKRLDAIKEKQLHEEKLAAQKRQYEFQQEKERQENKKREAEAAAKLENQKLKNEEQQKALREQIESQNKEKEERKRLEDEIARIQRVNEQIIVALAQNKKKRKWYKF